MDDKVKEYIANNKLMIFSKGYCPFAKKTKDLFNNNGVTGYGLVEMDEVEGGAEMHAALKAHCG